MKGDRFQVFFYNLSPSQFVEVNDQVMHRPISEILMDLEIARSERKKADQDWAEVLAKLNSGWK